jgi:hypothetical protein
LNDDFCRERKSYDDERLLAIGLHDQNVAVTKPRIKFPKTVRAAFDFDVTIAAEQRDAQVRALVAGAGYLRSGDAVLIARARSISVVGIMLASSDRSFVF